MAALICLTIIAVMSLSVTLSQAYMMHRQRMGQYDIEQKRLDVESNIRARQIESNDEDRKTRFEIAKLNQSPDPLNENDFRDRSWSKFDEEMGIPRRVPPMFKSQGEADAEPK
jgi:hypothetical protein